MFKFFEGIGDVVVHGAGEFACGVVPFEVNADVLGSIKVKFAGVAFADGSDEVVNIVMVDVFDTQVINYECEQDVTGFMEE